MIAFLVCFIIAFLIVAAVSALARHMGNPEPTDWATIAVTALLAGLLEATRIVSGLLA